MQIVDLVNVTGGKNQCTNMDVEERAEAQGFPFSHRCWITHEINIPLRSQ